MLMIARLRRCTAISLMVLLGCVLWAGASASAGVAAAAGCSATAYVTNFGAGTVSVIDTRSGAVTATITVGAAPSGVVFSPNGTRAYVANHFGNSVSVIDTRTHAVTATIPVAIYPWDIAITPDGQHVYTANDGGPNTPGTVSDITTQSASVRSIAGVAGANAVSVRPGGAQAYTSGGLAIATVVDTKTGALLQSPSGTPALPNWPNGIKLGSFNSEHIAFSPDGTRAYVTTNANGAVVVVDTKTRTVVNTIKVGGGAVGIATTPDGKYAYVVSDDGVVVVDTATGTSAAPIAVGPPGAEQVTIAPDGKHAYVTGGRGGRTVSVIDTRTRGVVRTIAVGSWPMGVAVCSARITRKH
jgi:YVTN family beta-propeller protein